MSQPADRSEETKKKLLVAARDLIVAKGWSSASIRGIAAQAGVNLALINYHFGGKKNLLAAMLDTAVARITEDYTPADVGADLGAFVAEATRVSPRLAGDPNVRVLVAAMTEAVHDPDIAAVVRRNLDALRAQLAQVIRASGIPEAQVAPLSTLLAAFLDGIMLHVILDPDTDVQGVAALIGRWDAPGSTSRDSRPAS